MRIKMKIKKYNGFKVLGTINRYLNQYGLNIFDDLTKERFMDIFNGTVNATFILYLCLEFKIPIEEIFN
jgi:hypothetical protein